MHCPKSHYWFGYADFEYNRLAKKGVNICIGTDSLASSGNPQQTHEELNMFDEMRWIVRMSV